MRRPWDTEECWEYQVLRALPESEARSIWDRAWVKAAQALLSTWWGVLAAVLLLVVPMISVLTIWYIAKLLGWGAGGRMAAEFVVHLILAYLCHRPLLAVRNEFWSPLLRSFLRAELILFVREELPAVKATVLWTALTTPPSPSPR
jgi:hypothetical protein